jgi:hypothetical protein
VLFHDKHLNQNVSNLMSEYLDDEAHIELGRAHTNHRTWHSMLFDQAAMCWHLSDSMFFLEHSKIDQSMIKALSKCLRSLHNLTAVQYHYDQDWIPARFLKVTSKYGRQNFPAALFDIRDFHEHGLSCFFGLHILIEAMVDANVQPKCLDLAVQMGELHRFIGFPSCERIKEISGNVETLGLRHRAYGIERSSKCPLYQNSACL